MSRNCVLIENGQSKPNVSVPNSSEILNSLNKSVKIHLNERLNLFFDQKMLNISLSPIIPINKIDYLFQLYKITISKKDLIKRILTLLNGAKNDNKKTCVQNGIKVQQPENQEIIFDEYFIRNCLILSKAKEGAYIIANRISNSIYKESIKYKYQKKDKKISVIAYLKSKDNIYIESDYVSNKKEAQLDVNKKIIEKYLPKTKSEEIINNINECIVNEQKIKEERKARYEKLLQEVGSRKLLNNKRKLTAQEFSRRLPYFNLLEKKHDINYETNDLIEEECYTNSENSENCPINELSLGDVSIVDNHLNDFRYTPLKIFEMIRDSEKIRGVDFKMEYSQINNKKLSINSESTIFSQKLGIRVQGFGKSKDEAENKCALNLLNILFKNKFKTYFELHNYFEHKNRKYLDIILNDENDEDNNKDCLRPSESISKNKKIKKEKINDCNCNDNNKENVEINNTKPISFNKNNITFEENENSSHANTDSVENLGNIRIGFANLFKCNLCNNVGYNSSGNSSCVNSSSSSNANGKLIEELNKKLEDNSSSSKNSKISIKQENSSSSEERKIFIKKESFSNAS